ncbi:glycerate kinase [Phormidium sp. FACHB-592]|uniref:Glycerate kinase n=1 Tax=Stenomitos frigidus AS-A4 TaxID=2933935 RepID=A0ABV0KVJ8_9CYAN|nr:glycerate kinase [Phormidium sp. FACHB-592]MBD2075860.1 glycerate kinase [Phormidium sp. FACHB-592]
MASEIASRAVLKELVERLAVGESLTQKEWRQLEAATLQDTRRAIAFGITAETIHTTLQARSRLLQAVYPSIEQFCQRHASLSANVIETLWHLWLPLAVWLKTRRQAVDRPWVQGILGGQGTGKTTLGAILVLILQLCGYKTVSLSLDDFYKMYDERLRLREHDPRLLWRGPPGTHDLELGLQTLDALRQLAPEQPIALPRFDKALHNGAGDRIAPTLVSGADIILFEGWFVGVRPVDPAVFEQAIAPIITASDRAFAHDMNTKLTDYLPLWQRLDSLIVLHPVDYRLSKQWRKQAEQQMRASGKPGMSDAEIDVFVEYFWKALHPELLIKPLVVKPGWADLVIDIQADHTAGAVYRGGETNT